MARNAKAEDKAVEEKADAATPVEEPTAADATDKTAGKKTADKHDEAAVEAPTAAETALSVDAGEQESAADETVDVDPGEAVDLVAKAKNSVHGWFSSLHKGWEEYTEDVRQPEDEAAGYTPVSTSSARTAGAAATPTAAAGQTANPAAAAPVQIPSPATVVKGAGGVARSFLNGVLGRPQPMQAASANAGKHGGIKMALKIVTGVFAAIGFLAVFRASMDAFRPRR